MTETFWQMTKTKEASPTWHTHSADNHMRKQACSHTCTYTQVLTIMNELGTRSTDVQKAGNLPANGWDWADGRRPTAQQ